MPDGSVPHPAYRRRAGNGPVFTSRKCPSGPGLLHTCELPFGFVWTPMSPTTPAHTTITATATSTSNATNCNTASLPPVLCLTCLSYLNLYATHDPDSGAWTCPMCQSQNAAPDKLFGVDPPVSPAMISPIVEYRQVLDASATTSAAEMMTASDGGGGGGASSASSSSAYVIVMDANLTAPEAQAVASNVENLILKEAVTEDASTGHANNDNMIQLALVTFGKTVSIFQLGMTAGAASADVIQQHSTSNSAPFDQDEGQRRNQMASRLYFTTVRTEADLATFGSCISAVFGVSSAKFSSSSSSIQGGGEEDEPKLSRKEMLKRKREARLRAAASAAANGSTKATAATPVMAESPWIRKQHAGRPPRCTGEAIQCAIDVAASSGAKTSRILLFTNGCPNVGEGTIVRSDRATSADVIDHAAMMNAIPYFEATGKDAVDNHCIGMDVFLSGAGSLGLQAYQALVDPSGGYTLPHDSFTSPQFAANLNFCLTQTFVSRWSSHGVNGIDGCIVDVRMSDFVSPSHVVGAMEVIATSEDVLLPNERSAFAAGASLAAKHGLATNNLPNKDQVRDTLTRVRMGRYDPLSTVSFMLQVNESITPNDKYAIFQCTLRYLEKDGKTLVTKVSTQRLPIARSVHDFLDSMDEQVVPVVLGKEAVFRSIVGREDEEAIDALIAADTDRVEELALEAQKDLDNTIHRISGAYRLMGLELGTSHRDFVEDGGVSSAHSSLGFAFPPELADALHRLFHLRRGSMLSPGPVRSLDDRAEIRNLFLRLPLDDCLCMMAPSLWGTSVRLGLSLGAILDPIPSDTMTLWDNRIIAADHHDALFVWSGKATLDATYDSIRERCKQFLLERSKTRFPMPTLYVLSEGDSMSRRFTSRLAPTHADPPEQQIAHFPQLASLTPADMTALRDKFRFYEESTDASFRRWFWSVASASSNARNLGMSLCE